MCVEGEVAEGMPDIITDPEDMCSDDSPQPTVSEILQAVQKFTASVDDLKQRFGGNA